MTVQPYPVGSPQDPQAGSGGYVMPQVAYLPARLADGRLVASWDAPGGGDVLLTRITVSAEQPCPAYVYVGPTPSVDRLVSGTRTGQFDENDPSQPIAVPDGDTVWIVWLTATGSARARIEYVRP